MRLYFQSLNRYRPTSHKPSRPYLPKKKGLSLEVTNANDTFVKKPNSHHSHLSERTNTDISISSTNIETISTQTTNTNRNHNLNTHHTHPNPTASNHQPTMKQKQQKRKQQQKKNPPPFHLPRLTHATWTSPIDSTTTNNNNINNNHNTKKSSASRLEIGLISFAAVLAVAFFLLAVYASVRQRRLGRSGGRKGRGSGGVRGCGKGGGEGKGMGNGKGWGWGPGWVGGGSGCGGSGVDRVRVEEGEVDGEVEVKGGVGEETRPLLGLFVRGGGGCYDERGGDWVAEMVGRIGKRIAWGLQMLGRSVSLVSRRVRLAPPPLVRDVEFGDAAGGEGRIRERMYGFEARRDSVPVMRSVGRPAWRLAGECRRRVSPRVSADGECLV